MNLSFQEKSLWLMLASLIGAFGAYFALVLPGHTMNISAEQVVLFGLAVAMLVILQILGHILIAILDRRAETDERDRLIALKGSRYGGMVLATGVFCSLCSVVLVDGTFAFSHLLLGFWVLAQVVEIGSQLYLYRQGA